MRVREITGWPTGMPSFSAVALNRVTTWVLGIGKIYKENEKVTTNLTTKDLQIEGTMNIIYVISTK